MTDTPQRRFVDLARSQARAALATVVGPEDAPDLGRKLLISQGGETLGTLGDAARDEETQAAAMGLMWSGQSRLLDVSDAEVFIDVIAPPPRLLIFGAIDYAGALCRLARLLGWRPYICDPRAAFSTRARFPEAEEVVVAWPDEAFAQLGIDQATYIALLTHDPKLDDSALRIALRSEAAYVGAMGSRTAQERRRERLLAEGMTEVELARLAAPIGLNLGAVTPEETALSIMAEIVAVRNGRSAGRLSNGAGEIHSRAAGAS